MTKLKSLTVIMLFFLLVSCGNDEDSNNQTANYFTFDGITYELKSGGIEDYGEVETGVYNFDITLITSEVNPGGGVPMPVDNIISGLYFERNLR